ncbi:MAG: hypothetical protein A4E65_02659 [Syntrophorhabdus sp. PtaU1.Bin153]|nr:MAG: hypothetical protein A4E65_02659 [Syntrophorhabdus sp. PtaU1.Bin153]
MKKKKVYEKPRITKEAKMQFPIRMVEAKMKKEVCRQCSSCHSCR